MKIIILNIIFFFFFIGLANSKDMECGLVNKSQGIVKCLDGNIVCYYRQQVGVMTCVNYQSHL